MFFYFTKAMRAVMGGKGSREYQRFEDLACSAYNELRRYSNLIITLFSLCLSCGIPELQRSEDIRWIRDKLLVGASDEVAATHFRSQIRKAKNATSTLVNGMVHQFAHG